MFSVNQKREIAEKIQRVLRDTGHPELPIGEIQFNLHVTGAESWSWADIRNNGSVINPGINPHKVEILPNGEVHTQNVSNTTELLEVTEMLLVEVIAERDNYRDYCAVDDNGEIILECEKQILENIDVKINKAQAVIEKVKLET